VARAYDRKAVFFGVAWHGSQAEAQAFRDEFDVPYDGGLDEDESIFRDYGFNYQPATVFVTKSGRIYKSHFGPLEQDELETTVRALLTKD
jgi:hypothetical protein